jgi:hypothetical protein
MARVSNTGATVCGVQHANDPSTGALPLRSNRRLRLIGGTVRDGGAAFVSGAKASKGHAVRRAISGPVELHNTPAIGSRCQEAKQKHGGSNTSQARTTTPPGSHSMKPVLKSCEIVQSKDPRTSSLQGDEEAPLARCGCGCGCGCGCVGGALRGPPTKSYVRVYGSEVTIVFFTANRFNRHIIGGQWGCVTWGRWGNYLAGVQHRQGVLI